jgi:hypothetical protein
MALAIADRNVFDPDTRNLEYGALSSSWISG